MVGAVGGGGRCPVVLSPLSRCFAIFPIAIDVFKLDERQLCAPSNPTHLPPFSLPS